MLIFLLFTFAQRENKNTTTPAVHTTRLTATKSTQQLNYHRYQLSL